MHVSSLSPTAATVIGGDFNDPTNERLIYLSALGLVVVGLGLLVVTILWWRRGRQEHPALGPLEIMGTRSWYKAPQGDRRRRLDQVRVDGAGMTGEEVVRSEPVDLEALVRSVPQAFDDLREPGERAVDAPEVEAEVEVAAEADPVAVAEEPASEEVEPDATVFVVRPEPSETGA